MVFDKARASIPRWITDALEQAESSSRDGRVPAAVLHPDRRRCADALVVCRLSEFAQLAGAVDFLEFLDAKKGNLNMRRIYGGGDTPMRPTV
jgi:hypothetical protein